MDESGTLRPAGELTGQPTAGACRAAAPYETGDRAGDSASDDGITLTAPLIRRLDRGQPADEPGGGRVVTAEWALWGKEAEEPDYRVLRCSTGTLSHGDFHRVITRYATGAMETLPQYTICWIPDNTGRAEDRYIAVGIHELAHADPGQSGGRARIERGRAIEYLRLFCVRYSELAEHRASYTELVEALWKHQLPAGRTDPISVELQEPKSPLAAPVRALAEYVAALLLTTRPVYILGAERATAEERLWFIDRVMSLLPYGLRVGLSASTWASATAQDLKLRLFFTNARRDDGGRTSYVTWSQPVKLDLSHPDALPLRHYLNWLRHVGPGAAAALTDSDQTAPVGFALDEIRRMVANLPEGRPVKDILEELAAGADRGDLPAVRRARDRLRRHLNDPPDPSDLQSYRRTIKKLGLLRDHPKLPDRTSASVYRVLLRLAFGPPITYDNYCAIEDCLGSPPRGSLRSEILKVEFSDYVPVVLAWRAEDGFPDQELMASLNDRGTPATALVMEFQRKYAIVRPPHRESAYDFAMRYLRAYSKDPRAELVRRGYLADTLEEAFPGDKRTQRIQLEKTLRFVYDGRPSKDQVREMYNQPGIRPTAAFHAAVARLTSPKPHRWGKIRLSFRRVLSSSVVIRVWMVVIGILVIALLLIGTLLHHGVHG